MPGILSCSAQTGTGGNNTGEQHMSRRSMRGIVRVLVFVGMLAILAIGGLFAVSKLASPTFIVEQLQKQVREQTGRELVIGGTPSISVFPQIAVSLPDVRLSNPPGMAKGDFLRMRKLDLQVELWPLLQRELIIRKLRMQAPDIRLLVDAKGRANWAFPASEGADGGDGAGGGAANAGGVLRRIRLAPIVIDNGRITFSDERSGTRHTAENLDVVVKLASPTSPLSVKGGAVYRRQRVKFSLFVKDIKRLTGNGAPVEAFIETAGAKLEYAGLAGFGRGVKLAGRLSASGPSLRGLLRWLGMDMPVEGRGLGRFALDAALDATGDSYTLQKLQLTLDDSRAQGSVRLRMAGNTTALTAALGVDRLVTDTYLGPAPKAEGGKRIGQGGGWSNAPIIPTLPRNLQADVRITVNDLRHRQLKMGPGSARFVLKNGGLNATLEKMRFYGGGLSGKLSVSTGGRKPRIAAAFNVDQVNARPFLVDLAGFDYLSGQLTGKVDVKSLGRSQLEIIGNLTGLANLAFREGKVHGIDLVKLMELVQKGIVNGWNFSKDATTDFVELVANFVIVDGIASVRRLDMKGPLVQVAGKGEVDLLRQRLDLSLDGALVKRKQGREKTLLRMPVPLLVKGPWQGPKIYPDVAGILKDPQAALQQLQKLMRGVGARKPAAKIEKVQQKVKEKVEAQRDKIEQKVQKKVEKQLEKVLGKEKGSEAAQQVTNEAQQQMEKLLKGIFGR